MVLLFDDLKDGRSLAGLAEALGWPRLPDLEAERSSATKWSAPAAPTDHRRQALGGPWSAREATLARSVLQGFL